MILGTASGKAAVMSALMVDLKVDMVTVFLFLQRFLMAVCSTGVCRYPGTPRKDRSSCLQIVVSSTETY